MNTRDYDKEFWEKEKKRYDMHLLSNLLDKVRITVHGTIKVT